MSKSLLSTTYFGPVQWYQKLHRSELVLIEQHESFLKQTYRNRCTIATTNGLLSLTVPVEHDSKNDTIRDTLISSHGNWQHLHWNALQSAYGDSPFFLYYSDDLRPFFEKKWKYLFDYNMEITNKMCELLDISPKIELTEHFLPISSKKKDKNDETMQQVADTDIADFRYTIRPKQPLPDKDFNPRRYYQVFEQRYGFQPNLSILDLLFCCGPESIFFL